MTIINNPFEESHAKINSYHDDVRRLLVSLSLDEILPGLSIGIMTMRKGEKSRFLLSPQYAFKQRGCPPRIPPAATGWLCDRVFVKRMTKLEKVST